ncbi:MAG: heavy metal translocating P-type ATPase metal-binding domain-containing protein [Bacteroidetes bacterium]|nr:heavy metal translocating P-type ATPase metal-binding domain-containing protein [Bacteroidota bacterium]
MTTINCFHCGDEVKEKFTADEHLFCCAACVNVYHLLNKSGLQAYYSLTEAPGFSPLVKNDAFAFLELEEAADKLLDFKSTELEKVRLVLPQIHCSSCIYLLENLHKLKEGILTVNVNFSLKEAAISYDPRIVSLKEIALLLTKIGYEPSFKKNRGHPKTTIPTKNNCGKLV